MQDLAFWLAVFAGWRVQAGICQAEAFDRFAAEDVGLNNLFDVGFGDVSIPNCVGVDHDVGAVFALIKAARLVGADFPLQAPLGQFLLEQFLQPGLSLRITTSAGMARRTLVSADEDVLFELGHEVVDETAC